MSATASETPQQRGHRMLRDAGYRSEGGKVTMPRVKRVVKRAITEHEDEEHGGKHGRIKLKSGGAVEGQTPKHRPDRRARRDMGGAMPPQTGGAPNPQMPTPQPQPTPQQIQMARQRMAQSSNAPPAPGMPQQPPMAKRGGTIGRRARGGSAGEFDLGEHNDGMGADRDRPAMRRARGGSADEFNTASDSDAFEEREKFENVDNGLSEGERDRDEGRETRSRGGRTRRADGGYVGIHQEHDDMKIDHRANGGMLGEPMKPHMPGRGAKGGAKTINVIVGHGDDEGKAQMAHQAGMQQGMQIGAQRAAAGPPRPPMAPPGAGMPPPGGGGMAGGPPMAGAPRPPMPPQGMPMGAKRGGALGRADGGSVRVREHDRRRAGGKC